MLTVVVVAILVVPVIAVVALTVRGRRSFTSTHDRHLFEILHEANAIAPALRGGLDSVSAASASSAIRQLLGVPAVAITDVTSMLAWAGEGGGHHSAQALSVAAPTLADGTNHVVGSSAFTCERPGCSIRAGVVAPLVVDGIVVGSLTAYDVAVDAGRIRAITEIARWVSTQIELSELDRSRARLAEAELRALRAQISPHFVYNALTAIASFVRTDPERARDLLLEFADFTRYSLRRHGVFTTLAEELRCIDQYLELERARFGDRLRVTLQVAPEVLPVTVPFLVLQPLVENAIRHGIETRPGPGSITIVAEDSGSSCRISIEDDGVGMDPDWLQRHLDGAGSGSGSIGLSNVDERLRQTFGDSYGLVVDTAVGAGTRISMRIPKYAVGVRAT